MLNAQSDPFISIAPDGRHTGPPASNLILRLLSALGGVLWLVLAALFTLGVALAAPLGVLVAWGMARRRGLPHTTLASWVGAVIASSAAIPLLIAALLALAPPGTLEEMRATMVSAQAQETAELPEWLQRMSSQAAQRPNPVTDSVINSPAFTILFGLLGLAIASVIMGTMAGTVGWLGALLLGFGLSGRWPARWAVSPQEPLLDETSV